ncbi:unnamed protein product [Alternaria alternata]
MTAKKDFPPRSEEKFLLESDEEFPLKSYEFELKSDELIRLDHDDDRFDGLEQEIFRALFEDPDDIHMKIRKDTLKSIVKLDKSLKSIKTRTEKELKKDVDLAGGLGPYWSRLELDDSSRIFFSGDGVTWLVAEHIAHRANSAVLANILKILQRGLGFAEWLRSGINIAGPNKNDSLFLEVRNWVLPEVFELLLLSGANPEHIDGAGRHIVWSEKIFLLTFHVFFKLVPEGHYRWTVGNGWAYGLGASYVLPHELPEGESPFITPDASPNARTMWIHFGRNNQGIFNNYESFEADYSIIVFPYLALTTIRRQKARRKDHEDLKTSLKSYKRFISYDHLERTLDEAYYPGLSREALQVRNYDQVVTHSTDNFTSYDGRETGGEEIDERASILIVPQLWLCKLGNFVVSACSMSQEFAHAWGNNEMTPSLVPRDDGRPRPANIQLGFIIIRFIDQFGKSSNAYEDRVKYPPPLDLFETRVVQILSEVRLYIERPTGEKSTSSGLEYRRERYFIHVISDVRSELAMIQHVLEEQKHILTQFLKDCVPASEKQHLPDWARIEASQGTIQQYMRRVMKIDGDAERIEKSIQDMLNLKRTHASIKDAHSSLILSTAVIGFTVITIVFTPLAFLTALFALKIDGFEKLQISGSDGIFHSGKIGGIFGKQTLIVCTSMADKDA